jgi:O-antigen ligase
MRFSMRLVWLTLAGLLLAIGIAGALLAAPPGAPTILTPPSRVESLLPGTTTTLDSPPFAYSPGWTVNAAGADPSEPADPWILPSGVITFTYSGADLLLQLALGDYWGYLYVTVDGAPANRIARIPGNRNSQGAPAGYRTFYAPELQTESEPTPQWVLVHRAANPDQNHHVRVEVWRSWGQTPLRAVAVDAQEQPGIPRWPFVALIVLGVFAFFLALRGSSPISAHIPTLRTAADLLAWLARPVAAPRERIAFALLALVLLAAAIWLRIWWLGPLGLTLLAYAALRQPSLWAAALLFALPFYYSQTLPILPSRATNLIDVGVLGGISIAFGAWLIDQRMAQASPTQVERATLGAWQRGVVTLSAAKGLSAREIPRRRLLGMTWLRLLFSYYHPFKPAQGDPSRPILIWIIALAAWSLIAAAAAFYGNVALREWRTVFLAAALFALLLRACRGDLQAPLLLLSAWLAGGVAVALIGALHFATDAMLIEAEGVQRVRSLYGSPNNLALYLERTLMPTLALLLLLPNGWRRWLTLAAASVQGGILLLTFSKGALILGLPAGLITLWLGGLYLLRRQGRPTRPLWWLAAAAALALVALLPFLGTERFQRLLDFSSGTGFTRLQLWRSSLQMALDHWGLGIGPDNFLYAYRSRYILPAAWQEPDLNHPHTWLLDWWTRLGLVGMILGLGWWIAGLRATWQRLRSTPTGAPQEAALWLGTLAAIAAALSHGIIDLSYAVPDLMLVWVLLTMLPVLRSSSYLNNGHGPGDEQDKQHPCNG